MTAETTNKFVTLEQLIQDMAVLFEEFHTASVAGTADPEQFEGRAKEIRTRLLDIFDWPTIRIIHMITGLLGALEEKDEESAHAVHHFAVAYLTQELTRGSIELQHIHVNECGLPDPPPHTAN
jgi:hypothetical protein